MFCYQCPYAIAQENDRLEGLRATFPGRDGAVAICLAAVKVGMAETSREEEALIDMSIAREVRWAS